MKRIWQLIFCAMLWPALCAIAQDLLPRKEIATPAPSATPAPAGEPTPTPIPQSALALIPPPLPTPTGDNTAPSSAPVMPDLSKLDEIFKTTTPGKEVELYRAHVEWRQLKNRTVNDPAVVSAKAAAEAANTDLEKRKRLSVYYKTFYARMRALASTPDMVTYVDSMRDAHLTLLEQPHVRPDLQFTKKPAPVSGASPASGVSPSPTPSQSTPPVPEPVLPEPSLPNE